MLLIFGDSGNAFILELAESHADKMSLPKENKYSLGTPSLMVGLDKGEKCECQFLSEPKSIDTTEHGKKYDISILLLSHPNPKYSSLDKKGMKLTWRTNCHVVRVTVMDDHGKGVNGLWQSKEFRDDWFDRTWTIDNKEDGNIWIQS